MRTKSPAFQANVTAVHGEAGAVWLPDIPLLLGEIEGLWDVRIGPPYGLSYNYLAPATDSAGRPCVVKLTVPGTSQLDWEASALDGFAGHGAVRLLDRDDSRGVATGAGRAGAGARRARTGPRRRGDHHPVLGDAAIVGPATGSSQDAQRRRVRR